MNHMSEAFWSDKRRLERYVIKLIKHLCNMQMESSHTELLEKKKIKDIMWNM